MATHPSLRRGSSLKNNLVERFSNFCPNMLFSASGDYSDYQQLSELLTKEWERQHLYGEMGEANVKEFGSYLANLCYEKRNKIDPYIVESLIGGIQNNESYLACCDLYGNYYESDFIASSFARYMVH